MGLYFGMVRGVIVHFELTNHNKRGAQKKKSDAKS